MWRDRIGSEDRFIVPFWCVLFGLLMRGMCSLKKLAFLTRLHACVVQCLGVHRGIPFQCLSSPCGQFQALFALFLRTVIAEQTLPGEACMHSCVWLASWPRNSVYTLICCHMPVFLVFCQQDLLQSLHQWWQVVTQKMIQLMFWLSGRMKVMNGSNMSSSLDSRRRPTKNVYLLAPNRNVYKMVLAHSLLLYTIPLTLL